MGNFGLYGLPGGSAPGAPVLYTAYLLYQEQQTSGTNGGTFTSGAWRTRVLNTEVADTGNYGTLASNQVTLAAGTYRCFGVCPAHQVNSHQGRLYNITDSAVLVTGSSMYAYSTNVGNSASLVIGRFTLTGTKVIELQHQCGVTQATNGLGAAASFGTETYASLELFREGP